MHTVGSTPSSPRSQLSDDHVTSQPSESRDLQMRVHNLYSSQRSSLTSPDGMDPQGSPFCIISLDLSPQIEEGPQNRSLYFPTLPIQSDDEETFDNDSSTVFSRSDNEPRSCPDEIDPEMDINESFFELQTENRELLEQNSSLLTQNAELSRENESLTSRNADLERKLAKLRKEKAEQKRKKEKYKREAKDLKKEVTQLGARIEKLAQGITAYQKLTDEISASKKQLLEALEASESRENRLLDMIHGKNEEMIKLKLALKKARQLIQSDTVSESSDEGSSDNQNNRISPTQKEN